MKPEEVLSGKDPIFSQARSHDPDLHEAVRRARLEFAERATVAADMRSAEIARLEMLWAHLDPVFNQLPKDAELFDQGLIPGERPRLYVDMVAFVEMGRDHRTYRFIQDTRVGRLMLAETNDMEVMADAVTSYIGRRLVQREAMMEADFLAQASPDPVRTKPREVDHASLFAAHLTPAQPEPASAPRMETAEPQPAPREHVHIAHEAPPERDNAEVVAKTRELMSRRVFGEYGTADILISYCSGVVTGAALIFLVSWAVSGHWTGLLPMMGR